MLEHDFCSWLYIERKRAKRLNLTQVLDTKLEEYNIYLDLQNINTIVFLRVDTNSEVNYTRRFGTQSATFGHTQSSTKAREWTAHGTFYKGLLNSFEHLV